MSDEPYQIVMTSTALRALSSTPPRGVGKRVAWAAYEFIHGPLLCDPRRVGKPLRAPLDGTFSARRGSFRILYQIDEQAHCVTITAVQHRADAYRPR